MIEKKSVLTRLEEEKIEFINAGWRSFRVDIRKVIKEDGQKCYGLTDFDEGVVSLARNMAPELARETLLHEITHIVLELCGLGGENIEGHTNEEVTTLVSRSYLLLMNLNPKLFEIILHG